jgi:hypothetical protein
LIFGSGIPMKKNLVKDSHNMYQCLLLAIVVV